MSKKKQEEMKSEGLRIPYDLLGALQARHRMWADDNSDPEIECLHLEIIELIGQTKQKYTLLLACYRNSGETLAT